jgi:tRNA-specific adenosine deaminase 2
MNATNRTYNGTRHAEFMAINDILSPLSSSSSASTTPREGDKMWKKKYQPEVLKECDLYVTIEPCIMCASLLRQFGIRKVYYGASNEKFGGTGGVLNIHRNNGASEKRDGEGGEGGEERSENDYEVSGGWLKEEAIVLLRRFYVQENGRGELLFSLVGDEDSPIGSVCYHIGNE